MDSISDFEELLGLLEKNGAEYLIVGGLAFIYHAKPRYTKDMDLWIRPSAENRRLVNNALVEFGSPMLIEGGDLNQILQIGVAPNRIDILLDIQGVRFETAWRKRIQDRYGKVKTNWIDLDSLIRAKAGIANPRHEEDVRVLRRVRSRRKEKGRGRS